jgi:hypothetical protein
VNVLSEEKKQQVLALGRLGWSLRRIERTIHIRRETAATYLKAAGIPVRPQGGWGRGHPKPAIDVSTDPKGGHGPEDSVPPEDHRPSESACEPYREFIESELAKGRNAMAIWQDLVDGHGFGEKYASVKRFVRKLRRSSTPEARVVIETAPGEEAQVDYGTRPDGARRTNGQVPAHTTVRPDVGIQPESRTPSGIPLQRACLGRAA